MKVARPVGPQHPGQRGPQVVEVADARFRQDFHDPDDPLEESSLDGSQDGWYLQGIWQFTRGWRVGARYDAVDSDNSGSDPDVLDEAGLLSNGHKPERVSLMTEWVPSEFSRIRLQYNRDDSYEESDDQLFLQYTFSIGAHGAHTF